MVAVDSVGNEKRHFDFLVPEEVKITMKKL